MSRRSFLKNTVVSSAAIASSSSFAMATKAASTSSNAIAPTPIINWRLASSFSKKLDTIFGASEIFCERVKELTNGKFTIVPFAETEIVPFNGNGVLDAVKEGKVAIGHTASYYYFDKDASFAFDCAVPFGLNSRQQTAWMMHGNGMKLMRDFFADYNIVNFLGGNTGTQMGGWFRKEIRSPADLKGLKCRVSAFAGKVLSKLGAMPVQIAGDDIYAALENATVDAAEWIGPYDDEKLGFNKVAKFYYYPGWWEGGAQLSFYVNKQEWDKLPKQYKAAIEVASLEAHISMQAKYDANNPSALARLMREKTVLKPFPQSVMEACFKATQETLAEESASNPKFQKIYDDWISFRNNQSQWFGVAEQTFARFSMSRKLK